MRKHGSTGRPRLRRGAAVTAVGALAAAALTLVAPAASAAAPDNDSWKHATEVTASPFEDSVDTTEATAEAVKPPDLGRFYTHTVWYHVTMPADTDLLVSTDGTGYNHKLVAYQAESATQRPAEWTKLDADRGYGRRPAGLLLQTLADTDYFVVIGAYRSDDGGTAAILMRAPAAVSITLDDTGAYDPVDGSAVLSGTVSSDLPTDVYLQLGLRQVVGDRVVTGHGSKHLVPSTEVSSWHMRVSSDRPFKLGDARVIGRRIRAFDMGVRIPTTHFTQDIVTLQ